MSEKILLIFDLDETLVHATEDALEREADFIVDPFLVYQRPGLETFLLECAGLFEIAFWSSASADYVEAIVERITRAGVHPVFVWSRARCTRRTDFDLWDEYFAKDLKKVKRKGIDLCKVLIVEDEPRKVRRNYGNAIYVKPFLGAIDDSELPQLGRYLATLSTASDVRTIEKRNWRSK